MDKLVIENNKMINQGDYKFVVEYIWRIRSKNIQFNTTKAAEYHLVV